MNHTIKFRIDEIVPDKVSIFKHLGVPKGANIKERFHQMLEQTMSLFFETVEPIGVISELSIKEFENIFAGEGQNTDDTPLQHIFPRADKLALYALTMSARVCDKIQKLFATNELAQASMLDAVASLSADRAAERCEVHFYDELVKRNLTNKNTRVLGYSPGYCGWHISGQKRLFQYLKPERIGITLNTSYLMIPIKSVSGVLVASDKEIHYFDSDYPFCEACKTYSCRVRMKSLSLI